AEIAREESEYIEKLHVQRMKKFTNYITSGIGDGSFGQQMRRVTSEAEFREICEAHLAADTPAPTSPYADGKLFCGFSELMR
ncbi:MAG: tRNA-dihydrouridine synthase family protein, partial [Verrucomicrobiota bacterium]